MTLLEVMVACAVFAVLYAIAVPNLQAMRAPYALEGMAYQVAAHIDMARQRAIARNARHRVVFTTSGYRLERETTANNFVSASGTFPVPHGITIGTPSPSNPTFNTRGMLAANVTLPLSGDSGTKTVTINVLGRSKVQ
jgi:Tfp pilus assembly protein FimT